MNFCLDLFRLFAEGHDRARLHPAEEASSAFSRNWFMFITASSWTESDFTILLFLHCGLDGSSMTGEDGGEELQLWKEHWGDVNVEEREAVRKVGLDALEALSTSKEVITDSYTELGK